MFGLISCHYCLMGNSLKRRITAASITWREGGRDGGSKNGSLV